MRLAIGTTALAMIVLFFAVPFVPAQVLLLADLFIVRIAILVGLIALVAASPTLAILAIIVIARIYVERNDLKIKQLRTVVAQDNSNAPVFQDKDFGLFPSAVAENIPAQPPYQAPSDSMLRFAPDQDTGHNDFKPVDTSINQKVNLPTAAADGSDKVIEQLFEWVKPDLAQNL